MVQLSEVKCKRKKTNGKAMAWYLPTGRVREKIEDSVSSNTQGLDNKVSDNPGFTVSQSQMKPLPHRRGRLPDRPPLSTNPHPPHLEVHSDWRRRTERIFRITLASSYNILKIVELMVFFPLSKVQRRVFTASII